jgi:hypothetical protein
MNRVLQSIAVARAIAYLACGAWLLGLGAPARADEDAKKVVEAAIMAHGGAEKLAKNKDKSVIQKGKLKIYVMGLEIEGTMEIRAGDKKFRQDIKGSVMGQDFNQGVVYDGKELWIAINGKVVMTLDKKEDLEMIQEAVHAEEAAGLVLLGSKDVELSLIGDDKVGDTPVVGIRVSKKGRKDVSLYFDKKTHLLKKIENRSVDFTSRTEVADEKIMSDYKEFEGQMQPTKVTMNRDGKKYIEFEYTSHEYVDKHDDSTWKKPE